ncbi:MAG: NADH-quinone oxidoreductase subunit J [bacterium]|nr:NADH-quinone oxidoreductase subunit J [bacterium]
MNALTLPLALTADGTIGTGETILFWIAAPLIVLAATALLFARKAAYAAIALVFVMIGLAAIYIAQDAMFLGIVQVIVYSGAIMMLFMFVLMLIGVDVADSAFEAIKGQRWIAVVFGLGVAIGLAGIVLGATLPPTQGLEAVNADTNPVGVAKVIFGSYPFAMQLTAALLIVAALAAMTLTHLDRIGPKVDQKLVADSRTKGWEEKGARIGQLPPPGVYARTNRTTVPAMGPGGEPIAGSVPQVLRIRGQEDAIAQVAPEAIAAAFAPEPVTLSRMPGMPGESAPDYEGARSSGAPAITAPEDASRAPAVGGTPAADDGGTGATVVVDADGEAIVTEAEDIIDPTDKEEER